MHPKTRILLTSCLLLAGMTILAFSSPGKTKAPAAEKDACCKKSIPCCQPEKKGSDDLMMESLSRQFIFITPIN